MSKLLKFKVWLSLPEAAEHLSGVLAERVTVADIYRFALAGHLVLSVDFINHARACMGHVRALEEADLMVVPGINKLGKVPKETVLTIPRGEGRDAVLRWAEEHRELFENSDLVLLVAGDPISETEVIDFERKVSTLTGVWDLPLMKGERLDIEQALRQEIGAPDVELTNLDGAYVVRPGNGQYAKLLEHYGENEYADQSVKYPYGEYDSYYPAGRLPSDAAVVIRVASIMKFVGSLAEGNEPGTEKPLVARERNNLLRIIGALAKEAGITISDGGGGAATIDAAVAAAGFDGPKEKAIRDVLSQVRKLTEG